MTSKVFLAVSGTHRKRTVKQVTIEHDGPALPYAIVDSAGREFWREGDTYVPKEWLEDEVAMTVDVKGPIVTGETGDY